MCKHFKSEIGTVLTIRNIMCHEEIISLMCECWDRSKNHFFSLFMIYDGYCWFKFVRAIFVCFWLDNNNLFITGKCLGKINVQKRLTVAKGSFLKFKLKDEFQTFVISKFISRHVALSLFFTSYFFSSLICVVVSKKNFWSFFHNEQKNKLDKRFRVEDVKVTLRTQFLYSVIYTIIVLCAKMYKVKFLFVSFSYK